MLPSVCDCQCHDMLLQPGTFYLRRRGRDGVTKWSMKRGTGRDKWLEPNVSPTYVSTEWNPAIDRLTVEWGEQLKVNWNVSKLFYSWETLAWSLFLINSICFLFLTPEVFPGLNFFRSESHRCKPYLRASSGRKTQAALISHLTFAILSVIWQTELTN